MCQSHYNDNGMNQKPSNEFLVTSEQTKTYVCINGESPMADIDWNPDHGPNQCNHKSIYFRIISPLIQIENEFLRHRQLKWLNCNSDNDSLLASILE